MTVRAKFRVETVSSSAHWDKQKGELHTITLVPATDGSAENDAFYAATPGGKIELATVNDAARAEFKIGKFYYVDFTEAP